MLSGVMLANLAKTPVPFQILIAKTPPYSLSKLCFTHIFGWARVCVFIHDLVSKVLPFSKGSKVDFYDFRMKC